MQRKATGEKALFKELWKVRKHKCGVCGVALPMFNVRYFSHCHTKQARPDLRLSPFNIDILCGECHTIWEGERHKVENDPKWKWLFEKFEALK